MSIIGKARFRSTDCFEEYIDYYTSNVEDIRKVLEEKRQTLYPKCNEIDNFMIKYMPRWNYKNEKIRPEGLIIPLCNVNDYVSTQNTWYNLNWVCDDLWLISYGTSTPFMISNASEYMERQELPDYSGTTMTELKRLTVVNGGEDAATAFALPDENIAMNDLTDLKTI